MKRLIFFALIFSLMSSADAQTKMSDFPTYAGNPNGSYVPVVMNNTNRKVDAAYFGFNKIDSASVVQGTTYDTLYFWKFGSKAFYKLLRAGSGGGGGSWGSITGAIADQSDLYSAFLSKSNVGHTHAATDITQTSSYRMVTDALINTWNAKLSSVDTSNIPNFFVKVRGVLSAGTGIAIVNGQISADPSFSTPHDTTFQTVSNVIGVNVTKLNALNKSYVNTASAYTVADGIAVVLSNYTGGTATITLPNAGSNNDRKIVIKNAHASNNVTVAGVGGGDSNTLVGRACYTYQSMNNLWYLISESD